jgi:hypothetical protein
VQVNPNGTIKFQNKTMTLEEFQTNLYAVVKAKPEQEFIIKSGMRVPYAKLKDVLDACADEHVAHLTVASPAPTPTSAPPANNLPAPTLIMHPSMETSAPPIAPSDAFSHPTNSPPPASP